MTDVSLFENAMREAIRLAEQGRFVTAPNPCVGAVVLQNGGIVGRGWHQLYGQAHAEVNAIADAVANGAELSQCTLVVTLEPCNHVGKTPPCVDAVLRAKIPHVVIGAPDMTAAAAGGAARLRENGVTVTTGILQCECEDLIADFLTWQTTDLPYTILKLASTLDGRIATRSGHSQWISCPETLRFVHTVRRHVGAVMVGGNTFYADDPRLTSRPESDAPPVEKQPLAIVVTSRLPSLQMQNHLLQDRPRETIFWTTVAAAASPKAEALRKNGIRVMGLPPLARAEGATPGSTRAHLDIREGLVALRREFGCLYVLCEGGGRLGLSLLEKHLAGELHLHLSPRILADNEATPLFSGLSPLRIDDGVPLRFLGSRLCGRDILLTLRPERSPGCRLAEL